MFQATWLPASGVELRVVFLGGPESVLTRQEAKLSHVLTAMLDMPRPEPDAELVVTVSDPDIVRDAPKALPLVVRFLRHHNGVAPPVIPKPLKSNVMLELCEDKFDAELVDDCPRGLLYAVIRVAHHLDIDSLAHLGCAKVASLIMDKSPDEIRARLDPEAKSYE